jgi:hypothetical protein
MLKEHGYDENYRNSHGRVRARLSNWLENHHCIFYLGRFCIVEFIHKCSRVCQDREKGRIVCIVFKQLLEKGAFHLWT